MNTQYTPAERKQIHDAFVAAKEFLTTPDDVGTYTPSKTAYVCCSVADAEYHYVIEPTKTGEKPAMGVLTAIGAKLAKGLIVKRLLGAYTYCEWLTTNGHVSTDEDQSGGDFKRRLQLSRHAWLDSLIEEFSH